MENNNITGETNSNFNNKHSLLSAQADLNTGTVFHNDPAPQAPIEPKPIPKSVQDASDAFALKMREEREKSLASLQATEPKPVHNAFKPEPLTHAESTKPIGNPFVGMSTQSAQANKQGEVVFADNIDEVSTPPQSGKKHLAILLTSVVLIIAALAGGFYYWYEKLGGKDMLSSNDTEMPVVDSTKTAPPAAAFPAAARATTTAPKPTANTFAPAPATAPKKAAFGDAEREIVSAYIAANVNRLSPIKSSSSFTIEDIRFDGVNRALVTYGDSDMSISAVVNFTIDANRTVRITSFNILEK